MIGSHYRQLQRPNLGVARQHIRCAAWLALASILLIFLGPLYSNSQALLRAQAHQPPPGFDPNAPGVFCGDPVNVAEHAPKASAPIPLHHAECGYCLLLSHTAPLAPAALDVVAPANWSGASQSTPIQEAIHSFRPYAIAQVRAPPAITV